TTQAQRKLFYKLASTERALQLREEDEAEIPVERIAKELDVSEADVEMMKMRLAFRDFSLDYRREEADGEGILPLDHLADDTPNPEDLIIDLEKESLVQKGVREATAALNEKERYILENRLLSETPMTLQEIGNRFQITRERARQIEQATKKKLRSYLEAQGLAPAA
ncbi:MAG: RNA polymerase subunit sigma-70, partial [Deltaproteobacteria bacterium]